MTLRTLCLAIAVVCLAVPARAQEDRPDPFRTARIRFGPLALDPRIGITNVGVDTNVFNEWDDPKKDFTATIAPGTDVWFRAGRTRLVGHANLAYVWFQQYEKERSLNADLLGRYEVNLFHFIPYVVASYLNTRDRPGFEIDTRARRFESTAGAGVDVPLTTRTIFGVQVRRMSTAYAADETFLGMSLRDMFDRTEDRLQASFRYKLTSLTTLVLLGSTDRARFTRTPSRNSDGVRVTPGVEFDAFAIIQGSAFAGVRKVDMVGTSIPDYQGPVASVDLGYTLLGTTRFAVQMERDVYYSYDPVQPYYVLTGITGTITQRVTGPFDVQARAGRDNLDYPRPGLPAFEVGRTDVVRFYGGGVGYRFGRSSRLGFNVESQRRNSENTTRTYKALRIGTSLTYGF